MSNKSQGFISARKLKLTQSVFRAALLNSCGCWSNARRDQPSHTRRGIDGWYRVPIMGVVRGWMLKSAQKCFPPTWPSAAAAFSTWQTCLSLPCQVSNGHNVRHVNQSVFFIHKAGETIKGATPQRVIIKVKSGPLTSHPAVSHWHRAGWGGRRWLVVWRIATVQTTTNKEDL